MDAQRTALQAERQDTQLRGQRVVSTILLAKALGGGWENPEAQPIAASKQGQHSHLNPMKTNMANQRRTLTGSAGVYSRKGREIEAGG